MSEKKERKKHRGTNGDGYMRQRKDGRWECRVMYGYRDDGKPNMVSFYGKSKNDVRNQRKAYEEKLDNGQNTKDIHLLSLQTCGLSVIKRILKRQL